jgi:hypothetical protein
MVHNKKKNLIKLSIISTLLLAFVITIFYLSEPTYIDGIDGKSLAKYDWIILPHCYGENRVDEGIVLQVDKTYAMIKVKGSFMEMTEFYNISIAQHEYRTVGKATIYHKINDYVGFNVMFITQAFIIILLIIVYINLFPGLYDIMMDED